MYDDVCYFWSWQRWRREINLPKSYYFSHSHLPQCCVHQLKFKFKSYMYARGDPGHCIAASRRSIFTLHCAASKRKRNENNRTLCGIGHRPLTQLDTYFNYRTLLAIYKNIMCTFTFTVAKACNCLTWGTIF